jgi:hypothetical protein
VHPGVAVAVALGLLALPAGASASFTTISGAGGTNTAGGALSALNAFEASIGGTNNGAMPGPVASGFRTINWDGVPDAFADPASLPGGFFNTNSPRGAVLTAGGVTGTNVEVSTTNGNFSDINASYSTLLAPFSPSRIFAPLGSNVTVVRFYVPGTSTPATVAGFGAIFMNVRLTNTSAIQYFDLQGNLLGTFFAPTNGSSKQPAFIGVSFNPQRIARVEITNGTDALSAANNENLGTNHNIVALDDFAYSEPQGDTPGLTVDSPTDGAVVSSPNLTVSGAATESPQSPIVSLTVDGTAAAIDSSHHFSVPITLQNGSNTITVTATNADGGATTVTRTVTLSVPPPPPPESPPASASNPPATPSNAFTITSLKVTKTGKGTLVVNLPGKGSLAFALTAPKLGTVGRASASPTGGKLTLHFKLSKKCLKALKKHSLKAKGKVTFTPTGGTASSQTKSIALSRLR